MKDPEGTFKATCCGVNNSLSKMDWTIDLRFMPSLSFICSKVRSTALIMIILNLFFLMILKLFVTVRKSYLFRMVIQVKSYGCLKFTIISFKNGYTSIIITNYVSIEKSKRERKKINIHLLTRTDSPNSFLIIQLHHNNNKNTYNSWAYCLRCCWISYILPTYLLKLILISQHKQI